MTTDEALIAWRLGKLSDQQFVDTIGKFPAMSPRMLMQYTSEEWPRVAAIIGHASSDPLTSGLGKVLENPVVQKVGPIAGGIAAKGLEKVGIPAGAIYSATQGQSQPVAAPPVVTTVQEPASGPAGFFHWLLTLFFPPLHHAAGAPQSTSGVVTPAPPSYPTQTNPVASPPVATSPREIVSPYRPGNVHAF